MKKSVLRTLKGSLPLVIIAGSILAVAIILSVVLAVINNDEKANERERREILNSACIPDGVTINDIDVGGLTYNEAVTKLQTTAEAEICSNINFTLTYGDDEYTIDSSSFEIKFNTEELVMEALGLIKGNGYLALKKHIDKVAKEGVAYKIAYTIDPEYLEESIKPIYDDIYIAPKNAEAQLSKNFKASYSSVISNNPFSFTDDVDGLEIDTEELIKTLTQRIDERDFGTVEIPTKKVKADITRSDIEKNTVLRAYFSTEFRSSKPGRIHNITLAATRLNNTCVAPGEVFSMEGTIGRRVDPNVWEMAPAVVSGGAAHQDQLGGGVCQVATTLYDAVIMSDLKIVHRQNHSIPSSYVPCGLDATINTDTIDFKWENNTDYNVYVFSWTTSAKEVYCAIYAQAFPSNFNRIEFRSTFKNRIDPTETEYIENSALKEGEWCLRNNAITGLVYESYAYYYNGRSLVDTKFVDTSTYKMHPKRYYVWSGYKKGDKLDPYKEMTLTDDGKFVRKYSAPVSTPTPTPVQTVAPQTTSPEPTPTPVETLEP